MKQSRSIIVSRYILEGYTATGDRYQESFDNEDQFKYCLRKIYANICAISEPDTLIIRTKSHVLPLYLKAWLQTMRMNGQFVRGVYE